MTHLATDMILGTVYLDKNIKNFSAQKNMPMPTGSSYVAIDKRSGNTAFIASNMETVRRCLEKDYSKYPCTAVYQSSMTPIIEAFLYVRSNARGVW